jgi:hypothetical protein
MKYIELTQGKRAVVDDADYELLNQWKWCYHLGYAKRRSSGGRKNSKILYMHREINRTPTGFYTDHIDGNKLNNHRSNLRTVTHRLNAINSGLPRNNRSGHKGVGWYSNGWVANIGVANKTIYLGRFTTSNEALRARQTAEARYFVDAT